MIDKKKIIILASVSSLAILVTLYFLQKYKKKFAYDFINNVGISVTIVGFIVTLFLLQKVADLNILNKEFKERETFKKERVPKLIKDLECLISYAEKICSDAHTKDDPAKKTELLNNIKSTYQATDYEHMKKVGLTVAGFSDFEKKFREYYDFISKSDFFEAKKPSVKVTSSILGKSQSFLGDVKFYEAKYKE